MNRIASGLSRFRAYAARLSPSQWVERNIVLPAGKYESIPGRVNFDLCPYLREPIDNLENPAVRDTIFLGPTRCGKTFVIRMCMACDIAKNPAPLLLFDSTVEKGEALMKKEIHTLIEANDVLRSRKPESRSNYTLRHILFPGCSIDLYGANSAATAAGDTVKHVYGNELDKWRSETDEEASMVELVRHRTESAEGERKHYFSTTPTTEDGDGWREFVLGDQRRFFVPCPHCGHMQHLVWSQVRWDPAAQVSEGEWDYRRVSESAHYTCESCGKEWTDDQRVAAVRDPRSEWRPTAVAKLPMQRSYQLTGLYGPLQSNRMGDLAVSFLASRRTGWFASRRDFWNSRMGEVYRDTVSTVTADKFRSLMAPYRRGELPDDFKADMIIIAVDVQTNRLPFVVMALNYAGDKRTVDHGDAHTWTDIDKLQRGYSHLAPESFVAVDIGFAQRNAETLEAIHLRRELGWIGVRGAEQMAELTKLLQVDPFLGTRQEGATKINVLYVSAYEFKVEWEKMFMRENDTWRTYTLADRPTSQEIAEQTEYFAQLLDERRVPRKRLLPGKSAFEWKSRAGNNHSFDCHVYILALYYFLSRSRTFMRNKAASERRTGKRTITVG